MAPSPWYGSPFPVRPDLVGGPQLPVVGTRPGFVNDPRTRQRLQGIGIDPDSPEGRLYAMAHGMPFGQQPSKGLVGDVKALLFGLGRDVANTVGGIVDLPLALGRSLDLTDLRVPEIGPTQVEQANPNFSAAGGLLGTIGTFAIGEGLIAKGLGKLGRAAPFLGRVMEAGRSVTAGERTAELFGRIGAAGRSAAGFAGLEFLRGRDIEDRARAAIHGAATGAVLGAAHAPASLHPLARIPWGGAVSYAAFGGQKILPEAPLPAALQHLVFGGGFEVLGMKRSREQYEEWKAARERHEEFLRQAKQKWEISPEEGLRTVYEETPKTPLDEWRGKLDEEKQRRVEELEARRKSALHFLDSDFALGVLTPEQRKVLHGLLSSGKEWSVEDILLVERMAGSAMERLRTELNESRPPSVEEQPDITPPVEQETGRGRATTEEARNIIFRFGDAGRRFVREHYGIDPDEIVPVSPPSSAGEEVDIPDTVNNLPTIIRRAKAGEEVVEERSTPGGEVTLLDAEGKKRRYFRGRTIRLAGGTRAFLPPVGKVRVGKRKAGSRIVLTVNEKGQVVDETIVPVSEPPVRTTDRRGREKESAVIIGPWDQPKGPTGTIIYDGDGNPIEVRPAPPSGRWRERLKRMLWKRRGGEGEEPPPVPPDTPPVPPTGPTEPPPATPSTPQEPPPPREEPGASPESTTPPPAQPETRQEAPQVVPPPQEPSPTTTGTEGNAGPPAPSGEVSPAEPAKMTVSSGVRTFMPDSRLHALIDVFPSMGVVEMPIEAKDLARARVLRDLAVHLVEDGVTLSPQQVEKLNSKLAVDLADGTPDALLAEARKLEEGVGQEGAESIARTVAIDYKTHDLSVEGVRGSNKWLDGRRIGRKSAKKVRIDASSISDLDLARGFIGMQAALHRLGSGDRKAIKAIRSIAEKMKLLHDPSGKQPKKLGSFLRKVNNLLKLDPADRKAVEKARKLYDEITAEGRKWRAELTGKDAESFAEVDGRVITATENQRVRSLLADMGSELPDILARNWYEVLADKVRDRATVNRPYLGDTSLVEILGSEDKSLHEKLLSVKITAWQEAAVLLRDVASDMMAEGRRELDGKRAEALRVALSAIEPARRFLQNNPAPSANDLLDLAKNLDEALGGRNRNDLLVDLLAAHAPWSFRRPRWGLFDLKPSDPRFKQELASVIIHLQGLFDHLIWRGPEDVFSSANILDYEGITTTIQRLKDLVVERHVPQEKRKKILSILGELEDYAAREVVESRIEGQNYFELRLKRRRRLEKLLLEENALGKELGESFGYGGYDFKLFVGNEQARFRDDLTRNVKSDGTGAVKESLYHRIASATELDIDGFVKMAADLVKANEGKRLQKLEKKLGKVERKSLKEVLASEPPSGKKAISESEFAAISPEHADFLDSLKRGIASLPAEVRKAIIDISIDLLRDVHPSIMRNIELRKSRLRTTAGKARYMDEPAHIEVKPEGNVFIPTLFHEIAHIIHFRGLDHDSLVEFRKIYDALGPAGRAWYLKELGLTDYGAKNPTEFFAEAFSAYVTERQLAEAVNERYSPELNGILHRAARTLYGEMWKPREGGKHLTFIVEEAKKVLGGAVKETRNADELLSILESKGGRKLWFSSGRGPALSRVQYDALRRGDTATADHVARRTSALLEKRLVPDNVARRAGRKLADAIERLKDLCIEA